MKKMYPIVVPWIVLVHAGLFLIFWLTNSLFYAQTNDYLTDKLGTRQDYILICLWIAAGVAVWSITRLVVKPHRLALLTGILYGLFSLVFLLFFYSSFWLLFRESPSQLPRIGQFLQYHRLIVDVLILAGIVLVAAIWLRRFIRRHPAPTWSEYVPYAALPFGLLILVWVLALVFPPGSVYNGALPDKPLLIAHRGASFLAPENTLASAELAAQLGAYGLETDLHISQDGVPFLMHDDTLERTTNVATVFPGREKERAEQFTLAEIQQLNTGSWFLQVDPYRSVAKGSVSGDLMQSYQSLSAPTLADELEIIRKNKMCFIFDLKQPQESHPYHDQFFNMVFQQIQAAGIDPQIWFLADPQQAQIIRTAAPQMTLVHGTDYRHPIKPAELLSSGYQIVNADFGLSPEWIRRYQQAGLKVNLYTVDEPWQYSHLWLLGVNSITSSNAGEMLELDAPVLGLPYTTYLALWSLLGLLALGTLFLFTRPK